MKAKDSQKEKWSWNKIIAAIPLLESVLAIKDMLLGHPGNELPRAVFAISLYLLLQELCRNELLILKKIIGSCKTALAGLAFSFAIEFFQYVFGTGISELDDLILNTFGVWLGAVLAGFLKKEKKARKKQP